MRRIALFGVLVAMPVLLAAAPAGACGGLVGENGTIQLTRTSTLAAYHDGIERYVTSFEFSGRGRGGGLDRAPPGRADRREAGRRLDAPAPRARGAATGRRRPSPPRAVREPSTRPRCCSRRRSTRSTSPSSAAVARQWASGRLDHGFLLTPDAPKVLDFYSQRSPVFMAARFDANRARALGQNVRRRHADHGDHSRLPSPGCRCGSSRSV